VIAGRTSTHREQQRDNSASTKTTKTRLAQHGVNWFSERILAPIRNLNRIACWLCAVTGYAQ